MQLVVTCIGAIYRKLSTAAYLSLTSTFHCSYAATIKAILHRRRAPGSVMSKFNLQTMLLTLLCLLGGLSNRILKELRFLTSLDLSSSQLTNIPESLGKLRLLKELNLKNNKLKVLPKSSENLYSLTKLDISENHMESLPTNVAKWRRLAVLSASHNKLVWCVMLAFISFCGLRSLVLSQKLFPLGFITRLTKFFQA